MDDHDDGRGNDAKPLIERMRSEGLRMAELGVPPNRTGIRDRPGLPKGAFRKAFMKSVAAEDPESLSEDEVHRLLGHRPSPGEDPG